MKKSLILTLILVLAVFSLYYWFLHSRVEFPFNAFLSFFGSLFLLMLIGAIRSRFQGRAERKAIREAQQRKPPAGDQLFAAIGKIEPQGLNTCTSPISGTDCLLYEYTIITSPPGAPPVECQGFGMAPSVIRTQTGDIRLLSLPLLDHVPLREYFPTFDEDEEAEAEEPDEKRESLEEAHASSDSYAQYHSNAREYIAQTQFSPFSVGNVFRSFEDMFTDEDGWVKKDFSRKPQGLRSEALSERLILPGDEVCCIGTYSSKKGGLIGSMKVGGNINQLIPGGTKEAVALLRKQRGAGLAPAFILFLVMHLILAAVLYFSAHREFFVSKSTPGEQESALQLAIQEHDLEKLETLLQSGVDPDARDFFSGTALLNHIRDPEVVRILIRYHADLEARDSEWDETPIMKAAREGTPGVVKMLIDAGVDLNARSRKTGRTALRNAITAERDEIERLLLNAGAKDERVTEANGMPLPPDGGEIMTTYHRYIRAIFARDAAGVKSILLYGGDGDYKDEDFQIWQDYHVQKPETVSGYSNDRAATLRVEGPTPSGMKATWCYQMEKQSDGSWKIQDEWSIYER